MEQASGFVSLGETRQRDPGCHENDPRGYKNSWSNGMSKREYFAGVAVSAILSNIKLSLSTNEAVPVWIVTRAIEISDLLLSELAKGK